MIEDKPIMDCHRSCEAMGTRFEVFLRGEDAEHLDAVAVAVLEEIVRLDGALSRFDPRSEIARINRAAGVQPVRVDREIFALLERCEQARQITQGYFNVTLGASLLLDAKRRTVSVEHENVRIDLGGIGKGYALDCGREILRRFNVESGWLQGGTSSVLTIGLASWPIDLRHPHSPSKIIHQIELQNCGFSCSTVRREGQTQSDIVNPLNQKPLAGDDVCAVLAANATDAEIFSTALLAMGKTQATQFLKQRPHNDLQVGWFDAKSGFRFLTG